MHPESLPVPRSLRHRAYAAVTAVVLLASLGGIAAAVTVGGGTLGGFEVDGNFAVDGGSGAKDWANVSPIIAVDDTFDSGFTQGSKELKPSTWACNTGGADPNKGNILRAYVDTRVASGTAYVDLGWVAQNISGQGDVHLNFEFDQNGTAQDPASFTSGPCTIPRTGGDLLVTYDFPGGAANPDIKLFKWVPAATPDTNRDGDWVDLGLSASAAKAAVNANPADDPFDGTIDPQRFGEATIDLLAAIPPVAGEPCRNFGYINVRSRSSGESITSSLQDKLPTTEIDLSTCGKIVVHKTDDHVPPRALAGAQFGLYGNGGATGTPVQVAASGLDGKAAFDGVDPGDYWVKEMSAPAGYATDPDVVGPVHVGFREVVDLGTAFVDPRDVGTIRIHKKLRDESGHPVVPDDGSDLDGASFLIFKDGNANGTYQSGEAAKLWPAETSDATCTVSGGTGYCDVGPLPTGTYGIHETAAPAGSTAGSDVFPVTIAAANQLVDVDFTNSLSPLQITLDKSGPTQAHVGGTIHYTFAVTTSGPKLHSIAVAELGTNRCDASISGPVKTGGDTDAFLESGETWTYSCDHVVSSGDPDPLPNQAQATGTDDFGRTVSARDDHSVDILHPAITLDKKVEGADHKPVSDALLSHSGDALDYSVTIRNTGDTPLQISALSDTVKASLPTYCTAGIGSTLAVSATITCAYTSSVIGDTHNVASVTGVDALGGAAGTVAASDETFVDVIAPAIEVVKTASAARAHEGDPVTYRFAVTNQGDVTLHDVTVDDNVLGHIGDIASLAPGQTVELTRGAVAPADDVTNVATACGYDPISLRVCDDDHHDLDVIHPAVEIVKTGSVSRAHAGDPITYSFAVTNRGDVTLTSVAVDDDKLGHIGDIATLAAGQTVTLTKDAEVPDADVRNVATACGDDPLGEQVCDDDDHLVDVIHPGIDVTKTASASKAHEGDLVTYTFTVHNTGDVALAPVTVVDDVMGAIGTIASLAGDAVTVLHKDFTVPASTSAVDNVVEACGISPVDARSFCDTDTHHLDVIHPAITLDKLVAGADHKPVSDALKAHEGDDLGYSVTFQNTGDTPLVLSALTDTVNSQLADSCSKHVGDTLAVGEVVACAYTQSASDDVHNVASVIGVDELGGAAGTVAASDETFVDVLHPAITVEKSGPALAHAGDEIAYSFEVTNTGDVPLTGVVVADDVLGAVGTVGDLAVGASTTLTKTFKVPADVDGIQNTATACGVDPADDTVCDDDPHTALVIHPDIQIVKFADPLSVEPGQKVTYSYAVTNIGDTTLTDVEVTDDILGAIGTIPTLAPTETVTLTRTVTIQADSPRTNIGTACGVDALDLRVCDSSDETITIVLAVPPTPRLPKTGFALLLWIAVATTLISTGLTILRTRLALARDVRAGR